MKNYTNTFLIIVLIIAASGCASGVGKLEIKSLSEVKSDEIIVVGKIKLDPALDKIEQELYTRAPFPLSLFENAGTMHRNKIHISLNKKPIDITHNEAMWEKHITSVDLEKTFFIRVKRAKALYYSGGIIKISLNESLHNKLHFPGGAKYQIKPGDKAIYIGTIEYYRDFNEVEKTKLINEYKQAQKDFVKKFGNKIKLRHAKPSSFKI